MNIELHIERLVLEGIDIPPGQHHLLRESVRAELVRLLQDGRLPGPVPHGGAVASVRAPSVNLPAGLAPAHLGRQLAGAIHRGLRS
jgi:hypothetical protein